MFVYVGGWGGGRGDTSQHSVGTEGQEEDWNAADNISQEYKQ